MTKTKDNVELVPLNMKYVKGFYEITKEYKKEHEERMKKEREDRKKTFNEMLNKSKNVVADELLFTATNEFFKDMGTEELNLWAKTCMDFVCEDLGYRKEQVCHKAQIYCRARFSEKRFKAHIKHAKEKHCHKAQKQ